MSQTGQSYYAVIPATVRYCKDLPPAARLLYGELTALANREGYCWASNKYFEDLYEVGDRTVRNWLEVLQAKNFIKVEIIREGFQVTRRIWITDTFQRSLQTGKKLPEVRKKDARGPEKNCLYNDTEERNIERNNNPISLQNETPSQESSSFSAEQLEKKRLRKEIGKRATDEQFDRGYACYEEAKRTQHIRNPIAWITAAINKQFKTKANESQTSREVAKKIERHFEEQGIKEVTVFALSKCLEISFPGAACPSKCLNYEGRSFSAWWEEVKGLLGRYKLPDFSQSSQLINANEPVAN